MFADTERALASIERIQNSLYKLIPRLDQLKTHKYKLISRLPIRIFTVQSARGSTQNSNKLVLLRSLHSARVLDPLRICSAMFTNTMILSRTVEL